MRRGRTIGAVVTISLMLLGLAACGGGGGGDWEGGDWQNGEWGKKPDPVSVVETTQVGRATVVDTLSTSSTVESESSADVIPVSAGIVLSVHKQEGDTVRKGDVLAVIDNVQLLEGASRARAEVTRLEEQVAQMRQLQASGAVSQRELQDLEYQLTSARSTSVEASNSAGQTRLKAPFAGVVAAQNVRKGQLATSSAAAFQVVDPETLRVVVQLPERDVSRVKMGQQVTVISAYDEEETAGGEVARIAPVIDATSGTFRVTIDLDGANTPLRPGQYVNVNIVVDRHEDVVALPKEAVVYENGDPVVYVVVPWEAPERKDGDAAPDGEAAAEAGGGGWGFSFGGAPEADNEEAAEEDTGPKRMARRTKVELGLVDSDFAEVVKGISEGDEVITVGQVNLKDRGRVRTPDEAPPKAEAPAETDEEQG